MRNVNCKISTVAETFVGGNLIGSAQKSSATIGGELGIVLVLEKEGTARVGTFNLTDNSPLWSVENQVLWSKVIIFPVAAAGAFSFEFDIKVKAMRKMKKGDRIALKALCSSANMAKLFISTTFFYKQ